MPHRKSPLRDNPPARQLRMVLAALAFLLFALPAPALEPIKEMETITRLAATIISKRHYTQHPLDDEMSARLFDEYFKTLDPNKMFFTKQDLDSFKDNRTKLDEQLAAGNLTFAFDVFNLYLKRLDAYEAFANESIAKGFDFSKDEDFEFNRSKADWLPDEDALKELWRKKIKNDILTLKLMERAAKESPGSVKKPDEPAHPSWAPKPPEERVKKRIAQFVHYSKRLKPIEALEYFLSSLAHVYDPHSLYMSPRSEEDFNISMKLTLVGIGALLSSEDGYTKIVKVMPGGPAEADGTLKPEDRIIAVAQESGEQVDIMDMPLSEVVNLIRGQKDTKVTLTVLEGSKGVNAIPKLVTLTRNTVPLTDSEAKGKVQTVKGADGKDLKIGVITLPSFYMDFDSAYKGDADYKSSTRDVAKLLEKFKAEGVDGILIDLRSNGGGSLIEAVTLTGLFIPDGPVVQVKGLDEIEVKYDEDGGKVAYGGPLAILINRMSASASEIFAAAIKDYKRGIIIGDSKSHGKGTVQTVLDLKNFLAFIGAKFPAGSVKFTQAKFYRVNGASTQIKGVAPDIGFPSFTDSMEIGEEKLDNALPWDTIAPANFKELDENLDALIPSLKERSGKRVASSKDFQALMLDIESYNKIKDRKSVSLNMDRRWQDYLGERKIQEEQTKLLRLDDDDDNPLQAQQPKDASKRKEAKDLYLDESLNVMADMVWMIKSGKAMPKKAPMSASVVKPPQPAAPQSAP